MKAEKPEPMPINVIPYDETWPQQFFEEAERIRHILGDNCIQVHHVGSTAVPNLAAKPIIDIIPVVHDISLVDSKNALMQALGYEIQGEHGTPFRRFFLKGHEIRTHHVHVFQEGSPEIERYLKFRDWMRTHAEDRECYARLKQELARLHPDDVIAYSQGKEPFIVEIHKKTGYNDIRVVEAMTNREWNAVHHLRHSCYFGTQQSYGPENEIFEHVDHVHFVMYQRTDIIGYAHLQLCPEHRAKLHLIVIDESRRRQRLGAQFLSFSEKWLKGHGYKSLDFFSPKNSLPFFIRYGYSDQPFEDLTRIKSAPNLRRLGKIL